MVERPIGANLRAALEDKGWSYTRLIAEMRRIAARERVTLPTTRSLVVMLSRWCNDQERPSQFYQAILSKALGCSPAVLGFVDLPEPNRSSAAPSRFVEDGIAAWGQLLGVAGANSTALSTAELLSGASWRSPHRDPGAESTVVSGKVGAELLDTPDAMTEGYRRLDRQLGAASVFDDSTHHLQRITRLKDASMATEHGRRLASAAGEVASLAAWQALDLGRPGTAWSYYCLATRAAREAGHRELHAYVVAETSYVLLFGGQVREALSLVKRARHLARGTTPRLRAWLAAAHAEASAIAGNTGDALRALDQADEAFQQVQPGVGPRWLSYFDQAHLVRWKGHCLVLVGQPENVLAVLQEALDSVDASFVRARAGALVDLATLHLRQGEIDATCNALAEAFRLARETQSTKNQRRIIEVRRRLRPWNAMDAVSELDELLEWLT
jgi:tetratricopeptide (TPR) repeat protein/transcriptional regulator with XRE-family HTH domain